MFKRLIATTAIAISTAVAANPILAKTTPEVPSVGSIIGSDVTGMAIYSRWTHDTLGNVVVCSIEAEHKASKGECLLRGVYAWKTLKNAVPYGKTYVGFSLLPGTYNSVRVVVYWK